jgi:hypothetical protein
MVATGPLGATAGMSAMSTRTLRLSICAALALGIALPVAASDAPATATATATATREALRFEAAQANAREPVSRVKFLRPIHSVEIVDPQAVLIWETHTRAWLVDLRQSAACRHLDSGVAIGIETATDTINTSNSFLVGRYGTRCRVTQIREVDVPGMRAAERAARVAVQE